MRNNKSKHNGITLEQYDKQNDLLIRSIYIIKQQLIEVIWSFSMIDSETHFHNFLDFIGHIWTVFPTFIDSSGNRFWQANSVQNAIKYRPLILSKTPHNWHVLQLIGYKSNKPNCWKQLSPIRLAMKSVIILLGLVAIVAAFPSGNQVRI